MSYILSHLSLSWLIAGVFLIVAELMIPGGFVMALMGLAAITVSLVSWLLPMNIVTQLIMFGIAVVMYTFLLKENLKALLIRKPHLDDPENEFKGKIALALTDINDQEGTVEYKGTEWPAKSDTLILPGSDVEIVEQESILLHVKPIIK